MGSWNLSLSTTAWTLQGPQSLAEISLRKLAWKMKRRMPEPGEEDTQGYKKKKKTCNVVKSLKLKWKFVFYPPVVAVIWIQTPGRSPVLHKACGRQEGRRAPAEPDETQSRLEWCPPPHWTAWETDRWAQKKPPRMNNLQYIAGDSFCTEVLIFQTYQTTASIMSVDWGWKLWLALTC